MLKSYIVMQIIYMAHDHCFLYIYHGQNLLLTVDTEIELTFDN